jgi:Leucine-rich repeat (LRR) protein
LNPIATISALVTLDLTGNGLTNISALAALTNLNNLDLSQNAITDITPLEGFKFLAQLNLRSNDLQNIDGLTNIPGLNFVDVSYNLLNLASNSPASAVLQILQNRGIFLNTEPQQQTGVILSAPEFTGPHQFQFTITSAPGAVLQVQDSIDMLNWSLLKTVTNSSGTMVFTDNSAPATNRFYRTSGQ